MISVIIPCYNCAGTIQRCFLSLKNQTYQDFEILAIDDGSTDETLDILTSLKKDHPNLSFKIESQKNQGVSIARNRGLELAQGEYISFVDSDDWVEPSYLEKLLEGMTDEVDISVIAYQQSNLEQPAKPEARQVQVVSEETYFKYLFRHPNVRGYVTNKLYRAEILKKYRIEFHHEIAMMEDLAFNVVYAHLIRKASVSNEFLYHYTIQENSAVTSDWSPSKATVYDAFELMRRSGPLTKKETEILEIDYTKSLLWLAGQLYRKGTEADIRANEEKLFHELKRNRGLFILKGYEYGIKYYVSYLLFLLNNRSLRFILQKIVK